MGWMFSAPGTEENQTMTLKQVIVHVGKLLLCSLAFEIGTILGGILAVSLKLPVPTPPQGADMAAIRLYMILVTPLFALALAVIAGGLGGNLITRTLTLSFFAWITYTLNTQLEASIVSTYSAGFWFAIIAAIPPAVLCSLSAAWLFPAAGRGEGLVAAVRQFFAGRSFLDWLWRLPSAAVAFMPIYFIFGLMVLPFTGDYYRQSMFGLVMPTFEQLLPILFIRSVLFLIACLPIIILWKRSSARLFCSLGLALFLLVGFVLMLIATWLPLYVRFPHTLEILADEFIYAGALVLLLGKRVIQPARGVV
jgi:hypothetical protein